MKDTEQYLLCGYQDWDAPESQVRIASDVNHPTKTVCAEAGCLHKLASKLPPSTQTNETGNSLIRQGKQTAVTEKKYRVSINKPVSLSDHIPQKVKVEVCLNFRPRWKETLCLGVAGQC